MTTDRFAFTKFVKERLYKIESVQAGTEQYDSILSEVMTHLREHNDSEEKNDLPQLEPKLGSKVSQEAATSFSRTKKFVPTRYVRRLARWPLMNLNLIP